MIDEWKVIMGGGTGIVLVYMTLHYLRNLSMSLKELITYIHDLQESVGTLNVSIATIIAERTNDSKRIDELRDDIKELQMNLTSCKMEHR